MESQAAWTHPCPGACPAPGFQESLTAHNLRAVAARLSLSSGSSSNLTSLESSNPPHPLPQSFSSLRIKTETEPHQHEHLRRSEGMQAGTGWHAGPGASAPEGTPPPQQCPEAASMSPTPQQDPTPAVYQERQPHQSSPIDSPSPMPPNSPALLQLGPPALPLPEEGSGKAPFDAPGMATSAMPALKKLPSRLSSTRADQAARAVPAGTESPGVGGVLSRGEGPSWKRLEAWQIDFLEQCFCAGETEVDRERREQLAQQLGVKPRQVAVWFQNRRGRWNLENRESEVSQLRAALSQLQLKYDKLEQCHAALTAQLPSQCHAPLCPSSPSSLGGTPTPPAPTLALAPSHPSAPVTHSLAAAIRARGPALSASPWAPGPASPPAACQSPPPGAQPVHDWARSSPPCPRRGHTESGLQPLALSPGAPSGPVDPGFPGAPQLPGPMPGASPPTTPLQLAGMHPPASHAPDDTPMSPLSLAPPSAAASAAAAAAASASASARASAPACPTSLTTPEAKQEVRQKLAATLQLISAILVQSVNQQQQQQQQKQEQQQPPQQPQQRHQQGQGRQHQGSPDPQCPAAAFPYQAMDQASTGLGKRSLAESRVGELFSALRPAKMSREQAPSAPGPLPCQPVSPPAPGPQCPAPEASPSSSNSSAQSMLEDQGRSAPTPGEVDSTLPQGCPGACGPPGAALGAANNSNSSSNMSEGSTGETASADADTADAEMLPPPLVIPRSRPPRCPSIKRPGADSGLAAAQSPLTAFADELHNFCLSPSFPWAAAPGAAQSPIVLSPSGTRLRARGVASPVPLKGPSPREGRGPRARRESSPWHFAQALSPCPRSSGQGVEEIFSLLSSDSRKEKIHEDGGCDGGLLDPGPPGEGALTPSLWG